MRASKHFSASFLLSLSKDTVLEVCLRLHGSRCLCTPEKGVYAKTKTEQEDWIFSLFGTNKKCLGWVSLSLLFVPGTSATKSKTGLYINLNEIIT